MTWLGESVLVTGGAGFIGSHLVEELFTAGARVTVLDISKPVGTPSDHKRNNIASINWRSLDIDLSRFDVIFHFAASAYVPPSVKDPLADFDTNCTATLRLLDALRHSRWPGRLVFASSAAVYGNPTWSSLREDHPTVPVSPYGVGKLAAERYCTVFAELYGLNITSLRLFSVYGPRQHKQVVYDLMSKIAANPDRIEIHGDGTQSRDLVYVQDAVAAAMLVAEQAPHKGEVFNVATGQYCTIHQLATELCVLMGVNPRFDYTGVNRPGDPEKLTVNIGRLQALGYIPQVELLEGLASTVKWFKSR